MTGESSNNIVVSIRSRPLSREELDANSSVILRMKEGNVDVISSQKGDSHFSFDHAFWSTNAAVAGNKNPQASQEKLFHSIGKEALDAAFEGRNVTVVAYGQAGSGKSYSLMGEDMPRDAHGLAQRFGEAAFAEAHAKKQEPNGPQEVLVEISCLEIWGGEHHVRDLIHAEPKTFFAHEEDSSPEVFYHHTAGDGGKSTGAATSGVSGVVKALVTSKEEYSRLLRDATRLRNKVSGPSPSHTVMTVTLTQKKETGSGVLTKVSHVQFVDLAGNEMNISPDHQRLLERKHGEKQVRGIAESLSALESAVLSLSEAGTGMNVREEGMNQTFLTRLLLNAFGGSSQTFLLATVSPASACYDETMNTLRFAERVQKIPNAGPVIINEDNHCTLAVQLKDTVRDLKAASANPMKIKAAECALKEITETVESKLISTQELLNGRDTRMKECVHLAKEKKSKHHDPHSTTGDMSPTGSLPNEEKNQAKIQELLTKLKALSASSSGSVESEIEALRQQIGELERMERDDHLQRSAKKKNLQRQTSSGLIDDPNDYNLLRNEDIGNVKEFASPDSKITVRALAKAYDKMGDTPAVKKTSLAEHFKSVKKKEKDEEDEDDIELDDDDDDGVDKEDMQAYIASHQEEGEQDDEDDIELDDDGDVDLDDDVNLDEEDEEDDIELDDEEDEGGDEDIEVDDEDDEDDIVLDDAEQENEDDDDIELDDEDEGEEEKKPEAAAPAAPSGGVTANDLKGEEEDEDDDDIELDDEDAAEIAGRDRALTVTQETAAVAAKKAAHAEEKEKVGGIIAPSAHISTIVVPSHTLPNSRYLREPFRVFKLDEGLFVNSKKERIWDVDFFGRKFSNLDMAGYQSFALPARNLFRVEKADNCSKRLILYFFEAPHPYELEFTSTERRQRFFELAMIQRRNSIMWCPSLVIDGENDAIISVEGTTVSRPNRKDLKVKGENKFMVARMPYEVIDLWFGCFTLQGRALPKNNSVFSSFIPKCGSEVYVIGITDVPRTLIGNQEIGNYFAAYLGTGQYYVLSCTSVESKVHKISTNNVILVIVRRSFLIRMSHVQATEITQFRKEGVSKGDFSAVGATFRINEASFGIILVNANPLVTDPGVRAACIRGIMANFPYGNKELDIGVRFDYLMVSSEFGFRDDFTEDDMLVKQMKAGNLLTDFNEGKTHPSLSSELNPFRIFYWVRPRICRLDVKEYQASRALTLNNAFIHADVFCQRAFLSTFGEEVRRTTFVFDNLSIAGTRIPSVNSAELHINAEWIENSPIVAQLTRSQGAYVASGRNIPQLIPVIHHKDFLRLQHCEFSLFGVLPSAKDKKKIVLATGTLSLKNTFSLGETVDFATVMYYRGCNVGMLQGVVLQVESDKSIPSAVAALQADRDSVLVSCSENQVYNRKNGDWTPAIHTEHGCWDWAELRSKDQEKRRDEFFLPDDSKWKWVGGWKHEARSTDPNGWFYGTNFDNATSMSKNSKFHTFRKRRWTRSMQACDAITAHNYIMENQQ